MSISSDNTGDISKLKNKLRSQLRIRRKQLSSAQRLSAEQNLSNALTNLVEFQRAATIALYLPSDGEISTIATIRIAEHQNKRCFIPFVQGQNMRFLEYALGDQLVNNRYGIPEPNQGSPEISSDQLDLVLLPLVGFDRQGRRLGMGGGYYDRCFSFTKHKNKVSKPLLIGLAHSCQESPELPNEEWDIALDLIISDRGVVYTKSKNAINS